MKLRSKIKTLSAIILMLIFSYQVFSQKVSDIQKVIKVKQPETSCIEVTNTADAPVTFTLNMNDNFYITAVDIEDKVKALSALNKDSLYVSAWKFMCNNYLNDATLIKDFWPTTLTLYFNSLGSFHCYKQSIVLYKLWKRLGYKARIWQFPKHSVPEVFINNKWQMFDPTYRVYYTNKNNEVAGVEELVKNPEIISDKSRINSNDFAISIRFKKSNPFKNPENNVLLDENIIPEIEARDSFLMELPPHSKVLFPGVFVNKANSFDGKPLRFYANYKLMVPPKWSGTIKNHLIIADIRGKGTVSIFNEVYNVEGQELKTFLNKYEYFIPEIVVKNITDTLEIVYFLNPLTSELKNENAIEIKGKGVEKLQTQVVPLPDSSSVVKNLRKQYFFYNDSRMELLTKELSQNINCIEKTEITNKEILISQMRNYFNCIYKNKEENYGKEVISKIETEFNKLPENYNYDKMLFLFKVIPAIIVFYDFEHADKETINYILTKPSKEF